MTLTTGLRHDHDVIRTKLTVLEELLALSHHPETIRPLCHSLMRFLDGHMCKEEQTLAPYAHRIQQCMKQRTFRDHAEQRVVLRDLNALFAQGIKIPVSLSVGHLSHLIDELREHMSEEEQGVFPVIDHAEELMLEQRHAASAEAPTIGGTR